MSALSGLALVSSFPQACFDIDACAPTGTAAFGRTEDGQLAVFVSSCDPPTVDVTLWPPRRSNEDVTAIWMILDERYDPLSNRQGDAGSPGPFVVGADQPGFTTKVALTARIDEAEPVYGHISERGGGIATFTGTPSKIPAGSVQSGNSVFPHDVWDRQTKACAHPPDEHRMGAAIITGSSAAAAVATALALRVRRRRQRLGAP